MSVTPAAAARCNGFGPISALGPADLPRNPMPVFPELGRLHEVAMEAALLRHRWVDDPNLPAEVSLPTGEELAAIVHQAISGEDPHLASYLPDADDHLVGQAQVAGGAGRDGLSALRRAPLVAGAGVVLHRATRFSSKVADLCDDLALAIGGPVNAAIAQGATPASGSLFGGNNLIIRLDPDNLLTYRGSGEDTEQPANTTLIFHGHRPTLGDVWDVAVRKATHWPRLRADLPFDLDVEVEAYGLEEPGDPVELLLDQFRLLFSEATVDDAVAGVRVHVGPVARPHPPVGSVPTDLADWSTVRVSGRFPGGIGRLDASPADATNWLAFADCAVQVEDHLMALMTALLRGAPATVAELAPACPVHDSLCAARAIDALYPLGVVAVMG